MKQGKSKKRLTSLKKQEREGQQKTWNVLTGKEPFPLTTRSREQVLNMLKYNPEIWDGFQRLTSDFQEELIRFSREAGCLLFLGSDAPAVQPDKRPK